MAAATKRLAPLSALLLAAATAAKPSALTDLNVRFGFPAPDKVDPLGRGAYLVERPQHTLSLYIACGPAGSGASARTAPGTRSARVVGAHPGCKRG
jgi:hypothetical protein